jgi:hypothetical protein
MKDTSTLLLLLNKIAGSVKLESADPIWQSLLSCGSFASADGYLRLFYLLVSF